MLWQVERKDLGMWVVLDILSFMVLVCAIVIVIALIALSVFVPTLIRTIKEELKKK